MSFVIVGYKQCTSDYGNNGELFPEYFKNNFPGKRII